MRRTVRIALVVGVLAAGSVVGVAAGVELPGESAAPAVEPGTGPAVEPGAGPIPAAPERVGTVEPVSAVLGYLGADRRATFHYPGAEYVKLHVGRFQLLPGDYLTVSDPAGREVHRVEQGWATSITGDTAVLTLHQTAPDPLGLRSELARLGVTVDRVARGLTPAERPDPAGPESVCGRDQSRDAACYKSSHPEIYRRTKAVARLLIDGVELCTAFRVGPQNRLLTNHHCIGNARQARQTEVWFNYQCAECDGWAVWRPTKVRAAQVLATDRVLDFTLFTVDNFPAVERFGYLELATGRVKAGEEVYIPQHPLGQPTRVALRSDRDRAGVCAVADPRADGYGPDTDLTYYCDTEGGSSGSPVLSRTTHRVIALHHFGGCPNAGVRIGLIRDRIASAL
ncbi:MAG TPA: trypsin-like peptidase domain-containing protein [Natronosporangium sp.]